MVFMWFEVNLFAHLMVFSGMKVDRKKLERERSSYHIKPPIFCLYTKSSFKSQEYFLAPFGWRFFLSFICLNFLFRLSVCR